MPLFNIFYIFIFKTKLIKFNIKNIMSLIHNMKQTFSGALEGQTKIHSSFLPLNASVAMFYLVNSNPTDEEIRKFSQEQKIEESIVRIKII